MIKIKKRGNTSHRVQKISTLLWLISFIFLSFHVVAHDEAALQQDSYLLKNYSSLSFVFGGLLIILSLAAVSILYEKKIKRLKKFFFMGMIITIIVVTLFLVGSTLFVNLRSETKGPVHWHADFEIYRCEEHIDIVEPEGFSNRIGSSTFHEHDDDRVHVEGVIANTKDVDLHNFFRIIGGSITKEGFSLLTNRGLVEVRNGDLCDRKIGKLQVFLYKVINPDATSGLIYKQEKLNDFENYILSPYSNVPPGDCIIIEFGEEKQKTDNICESYRAAIEKGDLFGS